MWCVDCHTLNLSCGRLIRAVFVLWRYVAGEGSVTLSFAKLQEQEVELDDVEETETGGKFDPSLS